MTQDDKDIPKTSEEKTSGADEKGDSTKPAKNEEKTSADEVEIGIEPEEISQDQGDSEVSDEVEDESDRYLRLAAEFDNYKKRTAREFGQIIRTANLRLLREVVDIVDNFERALKDDAGNNEGYRKGVELIYNQLFNLLKKENVKPIESVGKPFDPNHHEAMMQAQSDEYDEGVVCQEIQKGYIIDDVVLRHARVVVSNGKTKKDEKTDNSVIDEEKE
jgi:molecular chaperone GrpE